MKILVLHGPNLNLLGERPGDASTLTLALLNRELERKASELQITLKILQSNHEGALIDALHAQRKWMDGVILNPTALGPTSYALRDALAAVEKPAIEVHLDNLKRAPVWRRKSVLKDVCVVQLNGQGVQSYLLALEQLVSLIRDDSAAPNLKTSKARTSRRATPNLAAASSAPSAESSTQTPTLRAGKTLGRRPASPPMASKSEASKTIGRARELPSAEASVGSPRSPSVPSSMSRVTGSQLGFVTRALVQQKLADRLSGKLTPAALATWARAQWQEVQRGAPAESGQRELLEDLLQNILLFSLPPNQLSDDQLIELMTRLDG